MDEIELKDLLSKYIQNDLSDDERRSLFSVITSPENEMLIKEILFGLLKESKEDMKITGQVDFNGIFNKILTEINLNDHKSIKRKDPAGKISIRKIILQSVSIAAILIITFFAGSYYAGTTINNTDDIDAILSYNEITAPYGSNSEIKLPDGSEVILNAGSTLKYRTDFNSENRDLTLVGEAYFKVARNTELPLNVIAGNINIKAVGTEFNVKAYADDELIETTLVEGKVEITRVGENIEENKFVDLNPNQKAIYIKETESFSFERIENVDPSMPVPAKTLYDNILISPKVDVNQVAAWTQGKLIIRGEDLENLCIDLERKYDVTIIFKDNKIKQYRFTGVLLDETLEQVLSAIRLTSPIKFDVAGKTVLLDTDTTKLNDFSTHLK